MPERTNEQEHDDFEQGREDGKKGQLGRILADLPGNHPNNDAYYKGRKLGEVSGKAHRDE